MGDEIDYSWSKITYDQWDTLLISTVLLINCWFETMKLSYYSLSNSNFKIVCPILIHLYSGETSQQNKGKTKQTDWWAIFNAKEKTSKLKMVFCLKNNNQPVLEPGHKKPRGPDGVLMNPYDSSDDSETESNGEADDAVWEDSD